MAKKKVATKRKSTTRRSVAKPVQQASELTAYLVGDATTFPIEPASPSRLGMDETRNRFAYRCLPLVMANQNGWVISCPFDFSVRWNGGVEIPDLKVRGPKDQTLKWLVASHFGYGVLTFLLPYLFRTPPGINLWVKGPSNWVKDGIQPLEGVIETDWLEATFTMNWRMTRPNVTVKFEKGEPICMLVPVPRGLAESLQPEVRPISDNADLDAAFRAWGESRRGFNEGLRTLDPQTVEQGWQRDYMLGRRLDGSKFADHQSKLQLRPFVASAAKTVAKKTNEERDEMA